MNYSLIILVKQERPLITISILAACSHISNISDLLVSQIVHFNTFIHFIENDRSITARNHSFIVFVSLYLAHFWMNSANIAHLGSPKWSTILDIKVFMTFSNLITTVIFILFYV